MVDKDNIERKLQIINTELTRIDEHLNELKKQKTINPFKKNKIKKEIKKVENRKRLREEEKKKIIIQGQKVERKEQQRLKRNDFIAKYKKPALILSFAVLFTIAALLYLYQLRTRIKNISFLTNNDTIYFGDQIDTEYELFPKTAKIDYEKIEIILDENYILNKKAIKEGNTAISLKYDGIIYDTKEITIQPVLVESVISNDIIVGVNCHNFIQYNLSPSNATHKDVFFSIENDEIAEYKNGLIYGLSEGETKITISSVDGPSITCDVIVSYINPTAISIKGSSQLEKGTKSMFSVSFNPTEVSNKEIKWTSSNNYVASIDENGMVSANHAGEAIITASSNNGVYDTKTITVPKPNIDNFFIFDKLVTFGNYEQDNNEYNGKEAIEWLVYDIDEDKIMLVSLHSLDCRPYNTTKKMVGWRNCTLRQWLNNTFIDEAFSEDEKKALIRVRDISFDLERKIDYSVTDDKVSILTYEEIYAWDTRQYGKYNMASPTEYARANGAKTEPHYFWLKNTNSDETVVGGGYGTISAGTTKDVNSEGVGVRIVIWIDTSKID